MDTTFNTFSIFHRVSLAAFSIMPLLAFNTYRHFFLHNTEYKKEAYIDIFFLSLA